MRIEDGFALDAPPQAAWDFLSSPERVAGVLPGARITEKVDEETYRGAITVKVGPVAASYTGVVSFDFDEAERSVVVRARGQGKAGMGTADMTMRSRVAEDDGGGSLVTMESDVVVTGILAQMGRGMIQVVSRKMLAEFARNLSRALSEEKGGRG